MTQCLSKSGGGVIICVRSIINRMHVCTFFFLNTVTAAADRYIYMPSLISISIIPLPSAGRRRRFLTRFRNSRTLISVHAEHLDFANYCAHPSLVPFFLDGAREGETRWNAKNDDFYSGNGRVHGELHPPLRPRFRDRVRATIFVYPGARDNNLAPCLSARRPHDVHDLSRYLCTIILCTRRTT
jgi:hypothetical protein